MDSKRDSWVKDYEEVDFDIPYQQYPAASRVFAQTQERERMLPQPSYNASASPFELGTHPPTERAISPVHRVKMAHARSSSAETPSSSQESSSTPSDTAATIVAAADAPLSRTPRSNSFKSWTSSPLNPTSPPILSPFGRPGSRGSAYITRLPSEECRALSAAAPYSVGSPGSRGSMILYRRSEAVDDTLAPPTFPANRGSVYSTSGDSFVSLSSDSKYPSGLVIPERGLVAYAYDPSLDEDELEDDPIHDPALKMIRVGGTSFPIRGVINFAALAFMIAGFFALFVVYPVVSYYSNNGRGLLITRNSRINSTGQAVPVSFDPRSQFLLSSPIGYVDPDTPLSGRSSRSDDGADYELVFSDEFGMDGRTFYTGDDHFWEAADEGAYNADQVFTQDGHLVLRSDRFANADAPQHVSGLLRSRAPFCLGHGFAEVAMRLDGKAEWIRAYWTGDDRWAIGDSSRATTLSGTGFDSLLSLALGWDGAYPEEATSSSIEIDYVRYYQQKRQSRSRSCNSRSAWPVNLTLQPNSIPRS